MSSGSTGGTVGTSGGSGSSTPSRGAQSSSLSANLTAHLSKPVAPSISTSSPVAAIDASSIHSSPHGIRLPGHGHQNGKAPATAADSDAVAHSELWKSSAARRAEKAWAVQSEKTLQADAKFKKYAAAMEKCLATFESVSEWADFIAFLGRLLKILQTSPQFNAVPRKLIVAKRLSQCLNPALPSGVHQRALEVYEHIFSVIGPEGLRRDLSVWSPGLLPFFQFASMTVKPIVLGILETHYLPLRQDLRPIARPLQLALLPGLEEETGEHFERVLSLLDKVKSSIGEAYFYQNLWLILISMQTARLPALHYLARRLPDLNGTGADAARDILVIVGPDLGLTIRAFCAALEDETLLALRAMLDLLVVKIRIDSPTFKKLVRSDDKVRLMQSALAVVLRRDISLNRRLYAWLLGPSEEVKTQQAYFEEHALRWARLALLSELNAEDQGMVNHEHELSTSDRQRPYRILISLLDKWSLGLPITSSLIIDTFQALRRHLEPTESTSIASSSSSDLSTTAKMLFEAIDPFAMYRRLFQAICEELESDKVISDGTSNISLLRFVFSSFRVHDEESRVVHLPTLFAAIVELVLRRPQHPQTSEALHLARDIIVLIPKRVFSDRTDTSDVKTKSFVEHAAHLYETASSGVDEAAKRYIGFQHPNTVAQLLDICSKIAPLSPAATVESLTIFCQLLNLLDTTMDSNANQAKIPWSAETWMEQMEVVLENAQTFIELEACVETFVAASTCRALVKPITLKRSSMGSAIFSKLLTFTQSYATPYHVRTVELLWTITDLTGSDAVSAILCRQITSGSQLEREGAFETFGVLWKFSEEARMAHPLLVDPLLCILDGLRSSKWEEVQMAEFWVRNHARSFTALLDPVLVMLNDKECQRTPQVRTFDGTEIHFFTYTRPLDHERSRYALSLLLQLAHVGGTAMGRTLRSTAIQRSPHLLLTTDKEKTYADYIFDSLIVLLKSDAPEQSAYQSAHDAIHALAVDVLKVFITRVQSSAERLAELELVLLQRVSVDIAKGAMQVQGKYLQTLLSIMSARNPSSTATTSAPPPKLLLHTIKAGLSAPHNRPVLQQWTDFILSIAPIFRHALSPLLLPLNQGLCALIRAGIADIRQAYDRNEGDATCSTSDSDIMLLMAMSEKVLLQSLEVQTQSGNAASTTQRGSEKEETFSFMGALSNVFSTEPAVLDTASVTSSNAVWKSLHQTVMTLHLAWLTVTTATPLDDSRQDSFDIVRQNVQHRCRRYLERLYRNHSGEVVEALIACWHLSVQQENQAGSLATFEVLAFLAPSAQIVITFLCDVIATRISETPAAGEKGVSTSTNSSGGKHMSSPGVPDIVLLAFMEAYLARLDATASAQVWPVVAILVKEILSNSTLHKAQIFPTLRCLTVMAEKVMDEKNSADDRKLKRELMDAYVRICDLSILIAGRSFEQTTWIGRRTVAADLDADDGSVSRDEKLSASVQDISNAGSTVEAVQLYLAVKVLAVLKTFSVDADKLSGLTTNIIYYVVSPALKPKRKTAEVSPTIVKLLLAVTELPGTIKVWRTAVVEFFLDNRFFEMNVEAGVQWMPIIFALMNSDKEKFVETIGRISTPSTNIFTNREAETRMRVTNLRRMSYVIFAGPKDHWLTQLPLIQEKLVDLLRNSTADPAVGEVYLCLRVLLIRFESRHLSGFWPVVITEMMRLFESALDELPADNSDALVLLEAACHFLDLLVTLQTDEFQVHQWLFITDSVDIVYPPDDWIPESILDRLATAIGERRSSATKPTAGRGRPHSRESQRRDTGNARIAASATTSLEQTKQGESGAALAQATKRKPLLNVKRRGFGPVSQVEALLPFFANISLHAFESTYASGAHVDWHAIEQGIHHAFFPVNDDELDHHADDS